MALTVNTNVGAMVALRNLSATTRQLEFTQNRVSTGLMVSGAKDNASTFAIAQTMRSEVRGLDAVSSSLNRGISATDVAIAGAEAISNLLIEMKAKAIAATDSSIAAASRQALNDDFVALRDQITTIIDNAVFNETNILNAGALDIIALASTDATTQITVGAQDMSLGGTIVTVGVSDDISAQTLAAAMITTLDTTMANVNSSLAALGSSARTLETHLIFTGRLQDELNAGIGNLVDADMAVESAALQSLQVKQQLGIQALAIANQSPSVILSLFR